ncbi:hypothetical protein KEJ25_05160 [Candidatus Bathyarchaeota archaeon]|nr:hypothetical protein [Candidatus Bathyarchaeota archaeon]
MKTANQCISITINTYLDVYMIMTGYLKLGSNHLAKVPLKPPPSNPEFYGNLPKTAAERA